MSLAARIDQAILLGQISGTPSRIVAATVLQIIQGPDVIDDIAERLYIASPEWTERQWQGLKDLEKAFWRDQARAAIAGLR